MTEHLTLAGCTPIPLANYLKALGVLRLVAEQADRDARGYWLNEQLVLDSSLDAAALQRFFLEHYRPTPVLAPWNGGSGFYPKDNQDGIAPLTRATAPRLVELHDAIELIRTILDRESLTERPGGDTKAALLGELRAELPDSALAWLDAAVVLTEESPKYPPLLGTGGNDGRLDFTNNFMQRVVAVIDTATGEPSPGAAGWLEEALFASATPGLPTSKVGQFAPGDAGGPNQVSGFEADKPLVNPWDFIFMLEGALLFAAAATKRLEGTERSGVSYPFTVRATGAGSGSTATGDEGNARAEFWAPLWPDPVGLPELSALLAEGRATLGRRPARDGLDFARAVSRLGVDRGLTSFQRYAFLMRSGKAYFATPLNRISVRRNPGADLIDELDTHRWLSRFRSHARREGAHRVLSLARRLEDALFELATSRDDEGPVVRRLIVVLGEIQLYLARSPKARDNCPPVPRLSAQWFLRADDGSPEMSIAAALAGLHARDAKGAWRLRLRHYLAPERGGHTPEWDDQADHAVIWHAGARIEDNLAGVLARGLLETTRGGFPDKPLYSPRTAPLDDVADWLNGNLDDRRLARLLPGLALVDIPKGYGHSTTRSLPLPAAYRLLKPLFCTDEQLLRTEKIPAETHLPLPREIPRRLHSGDVAEALASGLRRLRAAGIRTGLHAINPGHRDGRRLLAALMIPIADSALKSLWHAETATEQTQKTSETD
ncbi:type I-U CRISPR-associated protein Csx17 [Arhodomonas aquaeolei]|uniref:type I-G CRISPR-associated protein Cas8g1/Csx17 n=1 Tax=Arhodomonas aquaeolei TaxID=2369 RepID=UPI00216832A5|nr:type I-U CRISPR-associated protein Csx17 [Arhodomonas aquaeolei]MCS4505188.1 type I-U CRISPR-associated protein Csx17 [Arhodomonas aquaeolei]